MHVAYGKEMPTAIQYVVAAAAANMMPRFAWHTYADIMEREQKFVYNLTIL